ncbi:hypothetical protein DL764_004884 [Monosporascus ibericus]|uniref:Major facilitator superfamily (MFS) profile domain-containing protein n=1 Tax=Monosporascus ibericus TaxID=155417 RepID=A0A4Q4TDU0_9PEZI|nr:hypothetical protein DL764_004884 [Monosporascus ibericus]
MEQRTCLSDAELRRDVHDFVQNDAPFLREKERKVELAAIIAKNTRLYDPDSDEDSLDDLQELTAKEKDALRAEKTNPFAEKKILAVFIAVSLAALLQGFVQSSQNGANLFAIWWGIRDEEEQVNEFGFTNAAVYWAAAIMPSLRLFLHPKQLSGIIEGLTSSSGNSAIRDLYVTHKNINLEGNYASDDNGSLAPPKSYFGRIAQLFTLRRLRNAAISTSVVALAQQLSGINVFAFYSGNVFKALGNERNSEIQLPMLFSFAFGVVNFSFGLFAFKTIDSWGRRKLLLSTLPFMSLCLVITAICFDKIEEKAIQVATVATFLLGPVPFTMASEAFARDIGHPGAIGIYAGLNIVAFVLIFLLVEETRRLSLEDLSQIYAVRVNTDDESQQDGNQQNMELVSIPEGEAEQIEPQVDGEDAPDTSSIATDTTHG